MAYKINITELADSQVDNIVGYLIFNFKSKQAAVAFLDDLENTYTQIQDHAESIPIMDDPVLKDYKYRKLKLDKHDYVVIYSVDSSTQIATVERVHHTLENYSSKIN